MKLFPLFFTALSLLNLSCGKEEQLPKATEKGANTFGCNIEGKAFVPERAITYPNSSPLIPYFNESDGSFELSVSEERDNSNKRLDRYLHLNIKKLVLGTNTLNEINSAEVSISEVDKNESFTTTNAQGGTVYITRLDTNTNIISGTFSFQAAIRPTNTPGKIIKVTDGRFDIRYE